MPVSQLITEGAEEVSFPLNKQIKIKNINDGQINKNSKYFTRMSLNKSSLTSSKDISLDEFQQFYIKVLLPIRIRQVYFLKKI